LIVGDALVAIVAGGSRGQEMSLVRVGKTFDQQFGRHNLEMALETRLRTAGQGLGYRRMAALAFLVLARHTMTPDAFRRFELEVWAGICGQTRFCPPMGLFPQPRIDHGLTRVEFAGPGNGTKDGGATPAVVAAQAQIAVIPGRLTDNRLGHRPRVADSRVALRAFRLILVDMLLMRKRQLAREFDLSLQDILMAPQAILVDDKSSGRRFPDRANHKLSQFDGGVGFAAQLTHPPRLKVTVDTDDAALGMLANLPAHVERFNQMTPPAKAGRRYLIGHHPACQGQEHYHHHQHRQESAVHQFPSRGLGALAHHLSCRCEFSRLEWTKHITLKK